MPKDAQLGSDSVSDGVCGQSLRFKQWPDVRYRCKECSYVSSTLLAQDTHHFKVHEKQPPMTYDSVLPSSLVRGLADGCSLSVSEDSLFFWISLMLLYTVWAVQLRVRCW